MIIKFIVILVYGVYIQPCISGKNSFCVRKEKKYIILTITRLCLGSAIKRRLGKKQQTDETFWIAPGFCCTSSLFLRTRESLWSHVRAGHTIGILIVMYPAGLMLVAHRVSTVTAAHEAFAEVVCQAALRPAISKVKWWLFDPFFLCKWPSLRETMEFFRSSQTSYHHIYMIFLPSSVKIFHTKVLLYILPSLCKNAEYTT